MAQRRRLLSLFSGCGGMDLGFEGAFAVNASFINKNLYPDWVGEIKDGKALLPRTSFDVVFANDILKEARAAYVPYFEKRGHRRDFFKFGSIVDLVKASKRGEFDFPEGIDIVTGGFPCQDFSVAGKRRGLKSDKGHHGKKACEVEIASAETRGQLYMWMREVISIVKPKVFYAENVKGLVSLGDVKRIMENDFRSIDNDGYLVVPAKVLNAADYGVPQNRERVIFIGLNRRYLKKGIAEILESGEIPPELNPYPPKTHFNPRVTDGLDGLMPYSTCRQAFQGLKEPENEIDDLAQMSYSKARFLEGYQGNSEIQLDFVGPTIRAEHHGNIEYRRLSLEHGGKYREELLTMRERRLTVRECARLQTFPDDYVFVRKGKRGDDYNLSASGAYRVIGNAVPPLLAYHLAKRIEELWETYFVS